MSCKNRWLDEGRRVYVYMTLNSIENSLGCCRQKACNLLNELEEFGLIERKRQGQGKPTRIYVKNFIVVWNSYSQEYENHTSSSLEIIPQEVYLADCNKNNKNNNSMNNNNPILSESDVDNSEREVYREYLTDQLDIEIMESLSGQLDEARGSIEDLLNRISESELKNQEELKKLLTEIRTEFAETLATSKEEIVETDTQHYEDLTNQMEALHGQIEVTQDKIATLQETMQDEHSKDMETIKKAFSEVKQELVVIQTSLGESQESIETLINDFASEEKAHHESTLSSLQTMKENLLQVNSDNFTSMITNLTEMEEAYMSSMEELTDYLGASFTEVNESISNTETNLQNQFDSKYQIMIDGQNEFSENTQNNFNSISNSMNLWRWISQNSSCEIFLFLRNSYKRSPNVIIISPPVE